MAKIVWSKLSLEDLQNIFEYISKDSPNYAGRQIQKIIEKVEQLKSFPGSGRIVPEFNNKQLRELIVGNYRVVYRFESEKLIEIARIHHSARILNK